MKFDRLTAEKLTTMLSNHHKNRLQKLKVIKNKVRAIYEADMMIMRYQKACLDAEKKTCQYETDLAAIKILITRNKDKYENLPPRTQQRLQLGLTKKVFAFFESQMAKKA